MSDWNQLFLDEKNIARAPEAEVPRFADLLLRYFSERPLNVWDVCCGAGRHTVCLARLGFQVYASDNAPNAIRLTGEWLADNGLQAELSLSDMTLCPWPDTLFHGVLSWDALNHNTFRNIQRAIATIYERLLPGGLFLATLKSDKAALYGRGNEIEPGTFILDTGKEAGVPHHYFHEAEIRELFTDWEILSLAEQVIHYAECGPGFLDFNVFPYTTWGILARKVM